MDEGVKKMITECSVHGTINLYVLAKCVACLNVCGDNICFSFQRGQSTTLKYIKEKVTRYTKRMGGTKQRPHQETTLKQGCPSLFLAKSSTILLCTSVNQTKSGEDKPRLASLSAQWLPSL